MGLRDIRGTDGLEPGGLWRARARYRLGTSRQPWISGSIRRTCRSLDGRMTSLELRLPERGQSLGMRRRAARADECVEFGELLRAARTRVLNLSPQLLERPKRGLLVEWL